MNAQAIHTARSTVYFHQWTRKGYAIFASLHSQVVIANVDKGITDVSLKTSDCMQAFEPRIDLSAEEMYDWEEQDMAVCMPCSLLPFIQTPEDIAYPRNSYLFCIIGAILVCPYPSARRMCMRGLLFLNCFYL